MSAILSSPVTVTPSGGGWAAYAVSGLRSDTVAVWGYMLRTSAAGNIEMGVRTPGVTTDFRWLSIGQQNGFFACGVNGSDQIEIFGNGYVIRVFGELSAQDFVAHTGALPTFTHTPGGSWQTNDYAATSGSNVARAAVVMYNELNGAAFRQTGSTDDRFPNESVGGMRLVGLNSSEQFDSRLPGGGSTFYSVGYFLGGITWDANATDRSLGTTGAYTDLTALPATALAGIYDIVGTTTGDTAGLRQNGSTLTDEVAFREHTQLVIPGDGSRIVEGFVSTTNVDFYLQGFISASFPTINAPATIAQGDAVTATVTDAPAASRSIALINGAVSIAQTVTGTDGSATFTANFERAAPLTSIRRGVTATARVTNTSNSQTADDTFVTASPAGQTYVDLTSVNTTAAYRISSVTDLAVGDQLQFRGRGGDALPSGFTAYADGTFGFTGGFPALPFEVRVFDNADNTLGDWVEIKFSSAGAAIGVRRHTRRYRGAGNWRS